MNPLKLRCLVLILVFGCTDNEGGQQAKVLEKSKQGDAMKLTSSSYADGAAIPQSFCMRAAGGDNRSPEYSWHSVPAEAKSLVLVLIDRHPLARNWIHWLIIDFPPVNGKLQEGGSSEPLPEGAKEMTNSFGFKGYGGPQPPVGSGQHRYDTVLYALSVPHLAISGSTAEDLGKAVSGKIVAEAHWGGTYQR